jgi:hypothetical protein
MRMQTHRNIHPMEFFSNFKPPCGGSLVNTYCHHVKDAILSCPVNHGREFGFIGVVVQMAMAVKKLHGFSDHLNLNSPLRLDLSSPTSLVEDPGSSGLQGWEFFSRFRATPSRSIKSCYDFIGLWIPGFNNENKVWDQAINFHARTCTTKHET